MPSHVVVLGTGGEASADLSELQKIVPGDSGEILKLKDLTVSDKGNVDNLVWVTGKFTDALTETILEDLTKKLNPKGCFSIVVSQTNEDEAVVSKVTRKLKYAGMVNVSVVGNKITAEKDEHEVYSMINTVSTMRIRFISIWFVFNRYTIFRLGLLLNSHL